MSVVPSGNGFDKDIISLSPPSSVRQPILNFRDSAVRPATRASFGWSVNVISKILQLFFPADIGDESITFVRRNC